MASPIKKAAKEEMHYLQKRLQDELAHSAELVATLESVKKYLNQLIKADQTDLGDGQSVDGPFARAARLMLEEIDQ